MTVLLVRHADAGDRGDYDGEDRERPLSRKGRAQAAGLVDLLAGYPIQRVLSSPFVRCEQTVQPLAGALGLAVESTTALAEAHPVQALALVRELTGVGVVLCTHGDIVPAVLRSLANDGMHIADQWRWQKGSVWVLHAPNGQFAEATYLPPPGRR